MSAFITPKDRTRLLASKRATVSSVGASQGRGRPRKVPTPSARDSRPFARQALMIPPQPSHSPACCLWVTSLWMDWSALYARRSSDASRCPQLLPLSLLLTLLHLPFLALLLLFLLPPSPLCPSDQVRLSISLQWCGGHCAGLCSCCTCRCCLKFSNIIYGTPRAGLLPVTYATS